MGSGPPPPPEFAKLNIADIAGNEKISYFSYLCTSKVIRQSILLKVGPPWKNFLDPRLLLVMAGVTILYSLYYYLLYHDRVRCTFN